MHAVGLAETDALQSTPYLPAKVGAH
jgi:hypothetical protein